MVANIMSNKGFYLGDICYVLGEDVYDGVWGKEGYEDGYYEDPKSGFGFAVAGTAYGDGSYFDGEGHEYCVDAGVIGLVPLELVEKEDGLELGRVFIGGGYADFEADNGLFCATIPFGQIVVINTREEEEEDDDWCDEEEEEEEWDDADDEMGYDPYLGCYTDDV